ncbi:MAG: hypothetical protein ACLQEQ_08915 [Nitrososphaerales archaeon]
MRFLEERAESLVFLDDSTVRVVKKDPYNVVKYKMFNGLTIRYVARDGANTLRVEEEDGGNAFLCDINGRVVRICDVATVSQAIIEQAAIGSVEPLFRLWKWHALLEELELTVQPNSGMINVTREGVVSIPSAVRVDVLERSTYGDGSKVAKILFRGTGKNDWLYRAFRNHSYAVALIGRDETAQVWMHYTPPEYRDRALADCEIWLAGGVPGDAVVFWTSR